MRQLKWNFRQFCQFGVGCFNLLDLSVDQFQFCFEKTDDEFLWLADEDRVIALGENLS